jgi:hypothetical protein
MRSSPSFLPRAATIAALAATVTLAGGCGHSGQSVAPSALAANPSNYDRQELTVSGTAKNPTARQMRRGTATLYQLCDNACINVIEFGNPNVEDGSQVTVTGRFLSSFGRAHVMTNVLVVGGHMGRPGGESASPSAM